MELATADVEHVSSKASLHSWEPKSPFSCLHLYKGSHAQCAAAVATQRCSSKYGGKTENLQQHSASKHLPHLVSNTSRGILGDKEHRFRSSMTS